jgi:RimJ/RimL family protein N-acetyltransferase
MCSELQTSRALKYIYSLSVIVRRAMAEDLAGVFDVFEATAAEGKWIGAELPIDRDDRLQRWSEAFIDSDAGAMFVAEHEGRIVGSASVTWAGRCGSGVLDLGMTVAPERRRQGIGARLLEACIEFGKTAGAHKITLQVWPHNDAARALYRRYGFEEEGYLRRHWRRKNGELWDAVVMGLFLE